MAGTRALFASIGASVALVAAAALTLLAVSAMFTFGGWGDFASPTAERSTLVFASATAADTRATDARAGARIVAPAPLRTASAERPGAESSRRDPGPRGAAPSVDTSLPSEPRVNPPPPLPTTTPPPPPPPASRPTTGDRVTKAGETLSATVQSTGTALAKVTEPLAPPVSAAVQQVLNLVAEAVRRTAEGLGGAVDGLPGPQR